MIQRKVSQSNGDLSLTKSFSMHNSRPLSLMPRETYKTDYFYWTKIGLSANAYILVSIMYGQILSLSGQDVKYKVTIGCRK